MVTECPGRSRGGLPLALGTGDSAGRERKREAGGQRETGPWRGHRGQGAAGLYFRQGALGRAELMRAATPEPKDMYCLGRRMAELPWDLHNSLRASLGHVTSGSIESQGTCHRSHYSEGLETPLQWL